MPYKQRETLYNIPVTDAGTGGKCILRDGSRVIIAEGGIPGDVVDVEIHKKKKGFFEGRIIGWKEYSKDRVQPFCSHFDSCGGCTWQNMAYPAQLRVKEKMVLDAMQRIGKVDIDEILPILPSTTTEYYRNRLDFAFSDKKWLSYDEVKINGFSGDAPGLGFHVHGRFDKVLDVSRCYHQPGPSNQIRLAIRDFALENNYPFFDIRNNSGFLRSLIIRNTLIGEVMVILIFFRNDEEAIKKTLDFIVKRFPKITSLYYVINPKPNDTVYDLEHHLYYGTADITEKLNGIAYKTGPKSFFQTNPKQAELLFKSAKSMAGLTGNEIVYDLYTGVGSIALYLAGSAKQVVGIETVEEAIEYAKNNAILNNISNVKFYAGDVKHILNDEFVAGHGKPDIIFTDPPRTGMEPAVVNKILELAPAKILYVSCNPATQARDLELMKDAYTVAAIQPVDMFPHTHHVENIALLVKS